MKTVLRATLSLLFVFILCLSLHASASAETVYSGTWGDLQWTIDDAGVLTISGQGDMWDFSKDPSIGVTSAWHSYNFYSVEILDGVTSISDYAFYQCYHLRDVTIPSSVTSIGDFAFSECISLQTFSLPTSLTGIGKGAFANASLTEIRVDAANPSFCAVDGVLFNKSMTRIVCYPENKRGYYVIPSGVSEIADYAFYNCYYLESVTFPMSLKSVGEYAFYNCRNLENVTFSSGMQTIGSYAFYNCAVLESALIPEGVTEIGISAFSNCSKLKSVTIPSTVQEIELFAFSVCGRLENLTISEGVMEIGWGAFTFCGIKNLTLPESVSTIGSRAFEGCDKLEDVVFLNNSYLSMSDSAFSDCRNLKDVALRASLGYIGENSFSGCSSLENVFYGDTQSHWNGWFTVKSGNDHLLGATFSYDSDFSPVVVDQPLSVTVKDQSWTQFSITAKGVRLSYRWQYRAGGSDVWTNGATGPVTSVYASSDRQGYEYRCLITNEFGTTESDIAVLSVAMTPVITVHPASVTVDEGAMATFSVTAEGLGLGYSWQFRLNEKDTWSDFGVTGSSITLTASSWNKGWQYRCLVSNIAGTVVSDPATLSVRLKPKIVTQPESVSTEEGSRVRFLVEATGWQISYQWQVLAAEDWTDLSDADCSGINDPSLYVPATAARNGMKLRCKVTNALGFICSYTATLTVTPHVQNYTITYDANGGMSPPESQTEVIGTPLTLSTTVPIHADYVQVFQLTLIMDGSYVYDTVSTSCWVHYTFRCWNTARDGSGVDYMPGANYTVDTTATLYAQWSESESMTPVTLPTPTREGYTFTGWAERAFATTGTVGSYIPRKGNYSLYATWSKDQFKIIYDANGGISAPTSQIKYRDVPLTLSADRPTRSGDYVTSFTVTLDANGGSVTPSSLSTDMYTIYAFTSWNTRAGGTGTSYAPGQTFSLNQNNDLTLYAQWSRNYLTDSVILPTPTRDGGTFLGWAANSEAENGITGEYTPEQNVTLYAIWNKSDSTSGSCGAEGDNVCWELAADGTLTISGTGEMAEYTWSVKPEWLQNRQSITRAVIEDGVTSVGAYAFMGCENLTKVTISKSVVTFGSGVFRSCGKLSSAGPAGSGSSIEFEWTDLIPDRTFQDCSKLQTVVIPEGVTEIGSYVFEGCESLTSVTIPNSVNTIGGYAFHLCKSLTKVTLPEGLQSIPIGLFEGCDSITGIAIPQSVRNIGMWAFSRCSRLTSITIPTGVKSISYRLFQDCGGLESISIPKTVKSISDEAFKSCSSLTDVYYDGSCAQWEAVSVGADNEALINAVIHFAADMLPAPDLILPTGLTSIEEEAFAGGAFTSAKLSDETTSVGSRAFADCPNLKYIRIPAATTEIASDAFSGVNGLTIIGSSGSYAETYAAAHGHTFVVR